MPLLPAGEGKGCAAGWACYHHR